VSIYVDPGEGKKLIVRHHETPACRLFADTLGELDEFAEKRLGLRYRHELYYLISWNKRCEALRKGATAVTIKQAEGILARLERKISTQKSGEETNHEHTQN